MVTDSIEAMPGVNILLTDTNIGTVTNISGKYEIRNIPAGEYEVRFSSVGYETEFFEVEILPNRTLELNVILSAQIISVGEVKVIGGRIQDKSDTRTSFIDLSPKEAKVMAGAAEDVLRTLQALPGVLAPNDFSSQLVVRGSGPDQNLIVIDDVEIFNPYRLYGAISMFNPQTVSEVNLVTGAFPAMYGDRLSAVLEVTNKEGNYSSYLNGSVNASIVDANLVFEGKIPGWLDGSWLLSSRRTYYDLVVEPFVKNAGLVEDNVSFPNFYDIQAKLSFRPHRGHKISMLSIFSEDGVNVVSGKNRRQPDSISVSNDIMNNVASLSWQYADRKKFINKLIFSYYTNGGDADFDSKILDPSLNRKNFEEVLPDTVSPYLLGFKVSSGFLAEKITIEDKLTYQWGSNILEAGAGYDFIRSIIDFKFEIDPGLKAFFGSNPNFRAVLDDIKEIQSYNRFRGYIQNNFQLSEKFYFQTGLRYDHYEILNKGYFAPRAGLSYSPDNLTTFRAGWGLYYQSPGYEKAVDRQALFDLNPVYTERLNAEKAIHYVFGVERWLTPEWNLRTEMYYKNFLDLIVQQQFQGYRFVTEPIPGRDIRYPDAWTRPVPQITDSLTQIPVNNSQGESYGFEVLLSKKNIDAAARLNGWISYSLAYADRYERGVKIPFRFDQRHTVNVVLNYKIGDSWDLGMRWQFGSGFPFTEPAGIKPRVLLVDADGDGKAETPKIATRSSFSNPEVTEVVYDIDYGNRERFNSRKPDYHRLDFRATYSTVLWNLKWQFYIDVVNVYNRKNVVGYDYFVEDDMTLGKEANNMFPILPTFGFNFRF
ncbi:MAG: TonB-dependent receptor [Ignavibacteriales bacterium]